MMEAREIRLERMLAQLQRDLELSGTTAVKERRRAVMRGIRIAAWCFSARMRIGEMDAELRAELFGTQATRAQCPKAEVEENDR
jgi:hypothetical protein